MQFISVIGKKTKETKTNFKKKILAEDDTFKTRSQMTTVFSTAVKKLKN
jgi:hypothetical protein